MIQTATWEPPSLCGCQLTMTADFVDGAIINGTTYRHPIPFTIVNLQIVNVCQKHQSKTIAMPDISILFETDVITGEKFQQRGYLKHPIVNPTAAHNLYQFLSQYGGQTHSYPCGCSAHQFIDENKNAKYMQHPRHTKKCLKHKNDTYDMQQATSDFKAASPISVG